MLCTRMNEAGTIWSPDADVRLDHPWSREPGSVVAGTGGRGSSWGMATPHAELQRGSRITVGVHSTLERVLFGPTHRNDGTANLIGALRTAMGMCGAQTLREFQQAELVIAPAIKTEGKSYQLAGLT